MIHRKPALAAVLGVLALVALFGSTVEAGYATRPHYVPNAPNGNIRNTCPGTTWPISACSRIWNVPNAPNSNVPNPCELGGGASIAGAATTPCGQ